MKLKRTVTILAVTLSLLGLALGLTACRGRGAGSGQGVGEGSTGGGPASQSTEVNTAPPPTLARPTEAPIEVPAQALPTETPTAQPTATEPPTEQATEVAIEAKDGGGESLEGAWRTAYDLPPGVPFVIVTSEDALETMITERMAEKGYGDQISNLNVKLDNGQITETFTLTTSQKIGQKTIDITADGTVVWAASIDGSGNLALTVVSADFGKVSLPPETLEPLNDAVAQGLTGAANGSASGVTLTSLTIDDGLMTVKGFVKAK